MMVSSDSVALGRITAGQSLSECLGTSRYVGPCLRALSLGLSLASDPLVEKAKPPSTIVSMIEYPALELTEQGSSPAATAKPTAVNEETH